MVRPLFGRSYAGPRQASSVPTCCQHCRRLRLALIPLLQGEKAGMRADVPSNISGPVGSPHELMSLDISIGPINIGSS